MRKTAVLEILDSPKLISRKIRMTEKSSNFHNAIFDVDARSTFSTHHSVPLLLTMIIGATVSPVLAHRLSRCRTFQSNNSCDALCAVRVSFVFTEECSCCCYSSGFFSAVHSCPPEECVSWSTRPPSPLFGILWLLPGDAL